MINVPNPHRRLVVCLASVLLVAGPMSSTLAQAQQRGPMYGQPYNFPATNRANNAIVMKQVESGLYSNSQGSAGVAGTSGSSTLLICGSSPGGTESNTSSGATGNSSCIILNNTTGSVSVGQDSEGNQNADSSATGADAVSEALNGNATPTNN